MKRISVLIMAIVPCASFAAEPSTSCPSGYVAVVEEYMDIADGSDFVTRGFVHYVCAGIYRIHRHIRHI